MVTATAKPDCRDNGRQIYKEGLRPGGSEYSNYTKPHSKFLSLPEFINSRIMHDLYT